MSNLSGMGAFGSIFNNKIRAGSGPKSGLISNTLTSTKESEKQLERIRNTSSQNRESRTEDEQRGGIT